MVTHTKRIVAILLLVIYALSFSAYAADVEPYASKQFTRREASLKSVSGSLFLDFDVATTTSNGKIGVSQVALHDVTSGKIVCCAGLTSSGKEFSDIYYIYPGAQGHRYYAKVTFYADGLTTVRQTNTITA